MLWTLKNTILFNFFHRAKKGSLKEDFYTTMNEYGPVSVANVISENIVKSNIWKLYSKKKLKKTPK